MLGVLTFHESREARMDEYDGRQFVGIDLHRRRSVIVRQSESGEQLSAVRIVNDPVALGLQLEEAGADPEVVLEATYGWYWAVDVLQAGGARVHLAHPLGVKGFRYRRVKNDLLTELSMSSPRGCVPGGVRLARFAAREQRCGCAAGVVRAGGAAAWFGGGDGRAVRAVSAC